MYRMQSVRGMLGTLVLVSVVAACVDSGGGPFHRPDVSVDRIVAPAVVALAADQRLGAAGSVAVLDHFDPSSILRDDRLPASIEDGMGSYGWEPPTDALSKSIRTVIEDALPGRDVAFVAVDPAPPHPDDPQCATPEWEGTMVRLAVLQGLAVHGDVFLVVVAAHDFSGAAQWSAARVIWQPGGLIGGDWVVGDIIDNEIGEPDASAEVLVELAVMQLIDEGRLGAARLLVLDHLDAATLLVGDRLPPAIAEAILPGIDAPASTALPDNVRDALAKYADGREVEFVPAQPQAVEVDEMGCGALEGDASFVRLALVPGVILHEPVFLVIAELWNGCAVTWSAIRLQWTGGEWVPSVIDGGSVSV